jgi:hypothetical protein
MGTIAKRRELLISEGLSNLLEKLLSDDKMFEFLADQSPLRIK